MESKHKNRTGALIKKLLIDNVVTILFVVICIAGIILANQPLSYVIGEISTRLFRNLILILALLVPVWAGMGMNFSIVLGAMAAQIGIIVSINFSLSGVAALILAFIVSVPLSLFFGNLIGRLFNRTKGQEMITGMIVGFFAKGLYDLVFMFLCGPVIPVKNETLLLTNGIGLTTPINLDSATKGAINKMWTVSLEKFFICDPDHHDRCASYQRSFKEQKEESSGELEKAVWSDLSSDRSNRIPGSSHVI